MNGIKSKDRVKKHGEVFTPDSIVNDMLDLVEKNISKDDIFEYIDTTYLEPSCGNGNFLVRILDRKLSAVQKLPVEQWDLGLIRAVSSLYAIDIQWDNIKEAKDRILKLIKTGESEVLELEGVEKRGFAFKKFELTSNIEDIIKNILDKNILEGDGLSGKAYKNGVEQDTQLIITEYKWNGNKVKMSLHCFNDLDVDIDSFDEIEYTYMLNINTDYSDEADFDF